MAHAAVVAEKAATRERYLKNIAKKAAARERYFKKKAAIAEKKKEAAIAALTLAPRRRHQPPFYA